MGWASGSQLMSDVINIIKHRVGDNRQLRVDIYADLIPAFESMDCDTLGECQELDDAFDEALGVDGADDPWDDEFDSVDDDDDELDESEVTLPRDPLQDV